MSKQQPTLNRKSSAPWDRLRPVKQDPLEGMGYVSKGDNRLLNLKTQENYYHKITARYMQFCTQHSKNLIEAFTALSLHDSTPQSGAQVNTVSSGNHERLSVPADSAKQLSSSRWATLQPAADPADELSTILTALRKLREGILATSASAPSPTFSQRVHVFNIRLAILALHPESYHASLRYLLTTLHSQEYPLPATELREMMSYLILDTALRLGDLNEAYRIRLMARKDLDFYDKRVDLILKAVVMNNWPVFWRVRTRVDGYIRAIMHWGLDSLRKSVLKAIGKSYMKCSIDWILQSTTGGEMDWTELVEKEEVGWLKEGDLAVIRKPKSKT